MFFVNRLGLLAALLALIQIASAATVTVTSFSCVNIYFTMTLTTQEIEQAQYLSIQAGGQQVSELQFNSAYSTQDSYQWFAVFTPEMTGGSELITFQLLDDNEETITAFTPVTQTLNFNCATTVTTTAAASSSPTTSASVSASTTTSVSSNNGSTNNGSTNNRSSSGSSSSTGAIAGGVVGGVAAVAIVALLAFCMMRKKKKQRAQQSRLRNDEADEAAFRAPNNDSTTSLATAPETANTPMMRDVSTKNVFADPTTSGVSGAPSGSSTLYNSANNQAPSKPSYASSSREQTRARSPSQASVSSPTSEFSKDTPMSQMPPPVPALPASTPASYPAVSQPASTSTAAQIAAQSTSSPASNTINTTSEDSSAAPVASAGDVGAGTAATATAAAAAAAAATAATKANSDKKDDKPKTSKWGFKRASKDTGNTSKPPYPQSVPEPVAVPAAASADDAASSTPSPTSASPEAPASRSRSFKVIQKSTPAPIPSMAVSSSASIAPSESSLNRTPVFPPRSGHATPAVSIRGTNYSRAPSVASMSAGFTDAAPPLPSGAASVASAPVGEFGGNMAGIGAGRSFGTSSVNSTKWHQQNYNIMPNFSQRALARSTQLDEDLIFGHLGMGLTTPSSQPSPAPAGNGSETGSSKSRPDPFGDR
uniref:receptor protein-tyrosine kinase n=1 Tax=Melanopsichium pennsylvanicum 4 TaxID=1398559 RepID=A0A077R606_9BASI|nr:putative protein [Melanopsichium pennsylvanicum 4]